MKQKHLTETFMIEKKSFNIFGTHTNISAFTQHCVSVSCLLDTWSLYRNQTLGGLIICCLVHVVYRSRTSLIRNGSVTDFQRSKRCVAFFNRLGPCKDLSAIKQMIRPNWIIRIGNISHIFNYIQLVVRCVI